MNAVDITAEDMLALLKIEAAEAMKNFKKDEIGTCKNHLDRAQELILAIQKEA